MQDEPRVPGDDSHPVPPDPPGFYEKLRRSVERAGERLPERYRRLIPWLLLLPDLFALLTRLVTDPEVPAGAKVKLGAVIAYLVTPVDIIPDFIPGAGQVDDLALVLIALADLLEQAPEAVIRRHWSGEGDVVEHIRTGARVVKTLLGGGLLARLKRVLRGGGKG